MMPMMLRLLWVVGFVCGVEGSSSESVAAANPIRRVVNLLQQMQKQVIEEGKRDEEIHQKFVCYCKTGAAELEKSISSAQAKMPKVTAALDAAAAKKTQLTADLKVHKSDRADAEDALAKATALRKKEAASFAKESSDSSTNIAALGQAIVAISKGMSPGFLQTPTASVVRRLALDMEHLVDSDRNSVMAFLSESQSAATDNGYAPASGEILGILKQMKDTMDADLAALQKAEKEAIAAFEELTAAKKKETQLNTKAIQAKTARLGRTGVEIENLKADLADTSANYDEDKKFLANMDANCAKKQEEWGAVQKTRAEELVALADTIKIINDDDALDLFKQTLPSPSLLQTQVTAKEMRGRALTALRSHGASAHDTRLDLIALAIHGKKVSFDKILTMMDDIVKILKQEQIADDKKKAYCEAKLDKTEDEHKELKSDTADLKKTSRETQSDIETLTEEIDALAAGIKALDKSVSDATSTRKAENAEYESTMASDGAAKQLLLLAKNRLNKFYNPRMYKAPPQKELSAEQQIAVDMGSEAAPTDAPSGIAGTGVVASLSQESSGRSRVAAVEAPAPPPEAVGAYKKKGKESAGVLSMMDLLLSDLDKEMTEMKTEEKDSQVDYDKFIRDSAEKRVLDSKTLEEKMSGKADAEALLQQTNQEIKSKKDEDYATAVVLRDLHNECDWLLSNFDVRVEARAGEVDAVTKAKAVLSGGDYSLVQRSARKHLRAGMRHQ